MTVDEPLILDSARKHDIADADILHAFNNPIRRWDMEDDLHMIVGGARSGELLEVGAVIRDGVTIIVHAMSARPQFLPRSTDR